MNTVEIKEAFIQYYTWKFLRLIDIINELKKECVSLFTTNLYLLSLKSIAWICWNALNAIGLFEDILKRLYRANWLNSSSSNKSAKQVSFFMFHSFKILKNFRIGKIWTALIFFIKKFTFSSDDLTVNFGNSRKNNSGGYEDLFLLK